MLTADDATLRAARASGSPTAIGEVVEVDRARSAAARCRCSSCPGPVVALPGDARRARRPPPRRRSADGRAGSRTAASCSTRARWPTTRSSWSAQRSVDAARRGPVGSLACRSTTRSGGRSVRTPSQGLGGSPRGRRGVRVGDAHRARRGHVGGGRAGRGRAPGGRRRRRRRAGRADRGRAPGRPPARPAGPRPHADDAQRAALAAQLSGVLSQAAALPRRRPARRASASGSGAPAAAA